MATQILNEILYEMFVRKMFIFLIKIFLSFTFFNSLRREFQKIIPLYVKKFHFKFMETVGREKPSDEDCLV